MASSATGRPPIGWCRCVSGHLRLWDRKADVLPTLFQPPIAQSNHLVERGLPVPALLHAPNESAGHAVVAGPAKLLQGQPLVARLSQRRNVGRIDAVVARLHELLWVRRRVAHLLHVRDVVPIYTVIPHADQTL